MSSYWAKLRPTRLCPDADLAVIGDIHGRSDLLERALERCEGMQIICVGDYVDRGPDSAGVIDILRKRPDVTCIAGNHEDMLLSFLDDPTGKPSRWLHHGGDDTIASFGINPQDYKDDLTTLRSDFSEMLGDDVIGWLQTLPNFIQYGNVAILHAGADPTCALEDQDTHKFRWGHPEFSSTRRQDGIVVVHGHTIVAKPSFKHGRISVDTGAYATGRLTIAFVSNAGVSFNVVT